MPTAHSIAEDLRQEASRLRSLAERYEAIASELATDPLETKPAPRRQRRREAIVTQEVVLARRRPRLRLGRAPYGYKADGTPRKRPAPTPEVKAKGLATRRAKATAKAEAEKLRRKPQEVRLRVLSSTTPKKDELADREVAYVTQEK